MLEKSLFGYGNATIDILNSKVDGENYRVMLRPGGIMNVTRGWLALRQCQKKNLVKVYMVGNYGDDEYSEVIQKAIEKDGFDTKFFVRLKNTGSRVYKIDLSDPEEPDIQRYKEGKLLRSTPKKDITPFLDQETLVFAQSFGTFFESLQAEKMINTYNIARGKGAETASDANIRQALVNMVQGKGKAVSPTEVKEKQRMMIDRKERGLRELSILKADDREAKILVDDFKTKKPIEKIRIPKNKLPKLADSILSTYDNIRMLAITKGKEGGYFSTRNFETFYNAVKLDGFVSSLGCGDGYSAFMTFARLIGLSDAEIAALSPFAALYTQVPSSYPSHLTPELIQKTIEDHAGYCKKIGADASEILAKLKGQS